MSALLAIALAALLAPGAAATQAVSVSLAASMDTARLHRNGGSPDGRTGLELTETERAWLRAHPVIRVTQDPGWPPVEFVDSAGDPTGISSEYLGLIEQRLGITFERVRHLTWQESFARLKRHEIDMTTSVAVTPQRLDFWAFTKPYLEIPIVVLAKQDVTYIANMRELSGRAIAVVDGYALSDWLERDFPEIRLVKVPNVEDGLRRLRHGEVFGLADNMLVTSYYLTKLQIADLKVAGTTPYVNAQCMAVRKDWPELAGILDKALASISEGERAAIYGRWVPIRYEHGFDYGLLWRALALFGAIVAGLALWIHQLTREVGHRRQAQAELQAQQLRLASIIEGTNVGTWEWNIHTGELTLNERWAQIAGYSLAELTPITVRTWERLVHPDDLRESRRLLDQHFRGALAYYDFECRMRHKAGHWVQVHDRGKLASRTTDGQPCMMFGTHADITERKAAGEALQDSLRAKEALLKEVHHRVKNNLQIISSLLRMQAGQIDHPATSAVLHDMQGRIRSMALLHETLYRSGNLAQVDLADYLQTVCVQLQKAAARHAAGPVHLEFDLASVLLDATHAVPCGLLVNELVSNCLKHAFPGERGGTVRISLQPAGDHSAVPTHDEPPPSGAVPACASPPPGGAGFTPAFPISSALPPHSLLLTVADDGAGLPPGFDLTKLHSLGLQLVADLAGQLQGTLRVAASRGAGASFTVVFAAPHILAAARRPAPAPPQ